MEYIYDPHNSRSISDTKEYIQISQNAWECQSYKDTKYLQA